MKKLCKKFAQSKQFCIFAKSFKQIYKIMVTQPSLSATLRAMKPGDTEVVTFDMFKHNSIRNTASLIGLQMDYTFSVHMDRASRTYTITRTR